MRLTYLSRPFLVLLASCFSVVVIFAARLTHEFGESSRAGRELTRSIRTTSRLNQELFSKIRSQVNLVRGQTEEADPSFPDRFVELDNQISRGQTEYLKLNIGRQERLTVESVKSLQSELGVRAVHIFELLRSGRVERAKAELAEVEDLEERIQKGYEALHDLQMDKLEAVQDQLDRSIATGFLSLYGLGGGFLLALVMFLALLRRRVLSPVKSIRQATLRVRDGDFSARAAADRMDEIGQVAQDFNFMAESLMRSYADLERKVEERSNQIRELQQEMIQTAKMSAVGQMISGVAHELNNPLTVIMGYTELGIMKLSATGADPDQLKLLKTVFEQSERSRKIVANLSQFARKATPEFERVSINELIEQVLKLRGYEFRTRNVSFSCQFDPAEPELFADRNAVQQVVLNLINNAYDAIGEADRPGTIWIRTRDSEAAVTFEVLDDGPGISAPERVFEPFYTTKEVGKGTGLGLSVCYGIVNEHKGVICASNWERGAHFSVTLPKARDRQPRREHQEAVVPTPVKHARTALVVDDEPAIVSLQTSFLSSIGVSTFGVASGAEAIQFLKNERPDVVISDVRMPGEVDGLGLFEWLGRNCPELKRRFIFVTGDSVGLSSGELRAHHQTPCLEKPFDFAVYCEIVRGVLEGGGNVA